MDALELIVHEGWPARAARFFQLGHDLLDLLDELSDLPVAWRLGRPGNIPDGSSGASPRSA